MLFYRLKNNLTAYALIIIGAFMGGLYPNSLKAQTSCKESFCPLSDLPEVFQTNADIGTFFNAVFVYGVFAAAFLAVFALVIAGFVYMTTESVSGKSDAKDRIVSAVSGLLLILLSGLLLAIINPDILNFNFFRTAATQELQFNTSGSFFDETAPPTRTVRSAYKDPETDSKIATITTYGENSKEFLQDGERFRFKPEVGGLSVFNADKQKQARAAAFLRANEDCKRYGPEYTLVQDGVKDLYVCRVPIGRSGE